MKDQKGITLIALVITIIVLLILAGVSIAMLTGDNGILTRAQQTSDASQKGEVEEAIKLGLNEILTNKLDPTFKAESSKVSDKITPANVKLAIENNNANIASGKIVIKYTPDATGSTKDTEADVTISWTGEKDSATWKIDKDTGAIETE